MMGYSLRFSYYWCARFTLLTLGAGLMVFGQDTFRPAAAADPGPRGGAPGAGGAISGLAGNEPAVFTNGLEAFSEVSSVSGVLTEGKGLGPRFNLDSCAGCHFHPAIGGSSPPQNPQIAVAVKAGALNTIPSFLSPAGPVREARFVRNANGTPDGGVAALFTIRGRTDAPVCDMRQPDFAAAVAANNVVFRIPTPVFGAGLIEAIDDSTILAGKGLLTSLKSRLGISGHENRSGNDGTITRFGWKAQNKSLFVFAAEAYNVEQGVTNDLFMHERDNIPSCRFLAGPEDHMDVSAATFSEGGGDLVLFSFFTRFLAPPERGPINGSVNNGNLLFIATGCVLCHTPAMPTGPHSTAALSNKIANLYSDLLMHNRGSGLADGVSQGNASGNEFRTAPLWGLGQRLFFLHDGRAKDLVAAIQAHSSTGSEAKATVDNYNGLTNSQKQDVLNFLRSL